MVLFLSHIPFLLRGQLCLCSNMNRV